MNEKVFSQPWMSWSTLGHAFWRSTRIPSRTGSVHVADVRDPVHLHQAVRTGPRHAEQAARPVVLERASRDRDARRRQRRPDGVALERAGGPAVQSERDRPVAADRLAGAGGEPLGHAVSPRRWVRRRGSSARVPSLTRPERPADLVRARVALGEEPSSAPVAMEPPLGLPTVDVLAEEQVAGQVAIRRTRTDPAGAFAAVRELERLARPAPRTRDQECHPLAPDEADDALRDPDQAVGELASERAPAVGRGRSATLGRTRAGRGRARGRARAGRTGRGLRIRRRSTRTPSDRASSAERWIDSETSGVTRAGRRSPGSSRARGVRAW